MANYALAAIGTERTGSGTDLNTLYSEQVGNSVSFINHALPRPARAVNVWPRDILSNIKPALEGYVELALMLQHNRK